MAAGNSHRDRMKRELREQGLTSLEDTYDDHRPRGYPPAFKNHASAAAAMANDRGRYSHARGGGNAGRGMGRGASMTARYALFPGLSSAPLIQPRPTGRPLDPAVDPDRPYVIKSKGPKKKAAMEAKMMQGTVVVKATDKAQVSKKKPGTYSSPRLDRGPLPDHVRQSLEDSAPFEQAMLAMFKNKAESGKHIIAEKCLETASTAPPKVQAPSLSEAGPVRSELSKQDASEGLVKSSLKVHHIEREELGVMKKSPDAFTDGNATTPNLSGFTPSLASQDEALTAGNSLAGLGIRGALAQDDVRSSVPSATDLMDIDVPGAKNASLTSPLRASPREQYFGTKEQYEEYKTLKEFKTFVESRPSQDFTQWLKEQKSGKPAGELGSTQTGKQHDGAPVDLRNGYTIGGKHLEGILGDKKNIAAPPKSSQTQTTPGLAQSKWASPQVKGLSGFKQSSGKRAHPNPPESASILDRSKAKLETIEEMSATVGTRRSAEAQATALNGKFSLLEQPATMNAKFEIQLHSQKQSDPIMASESHTGSLATLEPGYTHEDEEKATKAKPVNPFAPRESTGDLATKLTQDQPLGMAAKSKNSSGTPRIPGAENVEQPAQEQSKVSQPVPVKKGLSGSKWSTDLSSPLFATDASLQTVRTTKSNFKAGSIFGDSKNVQRSGSILSSIPVNTFAKASKSTASQATQRSEALLSSQKPLPNPFASAGPPPNLQQPRHTTPRAPIILSPTKMEPSSIVGDTKNVQKSVSRWGGDPASQSALGIERKLTGIKRTQAGPGYDWLMREQKAKEQEKLEVETKADAPESVDNMLNLANKLRNMYVSADDSDEEL